jgi:hypothetical protein
LTILILELYTEAKNLYQPMIERRKETEKIRAALLFLDEFKYFFSLPNSIKENIQKVIRLSHFGIEKI